MKANEWIKENGWDAAKDLVAASGWRNTPFLIKVKRLVESWEMVKVWQLPEDDNDETGIDGARLYLECYAFYSTDEEKAKLDRLKQAIADVESCL